MKTVFTPMPAVMTMATTAAMAATVTMVVSVPAQAAPVMAVPPAQTAVAAAPAAASVSASAGSGAITMILGLLLILALLGAIAWFLKRSGLAGHLQQSATARVVGGVNVGNRERVVVVEVADTWIVVGVAPGRINALATMPRQESASQSGDATADGFAPPVKNFAAWMKQTIENRNGSKK